MARDNKAVTPLRRTAAEVKRYRAIIKIVPIAIVVAALILIVGYVVSVLYMRFGAFTVSVNKFDNLDYALTLSESPGFEGYTSRLNAEISETITNIDGRDLPDWLDNIDGPHNGDNYIAYTFYCKNAGKYTVDYSYEVYIANMTLEIEKAARIRLYVDGVYEDFAYARTDGVEGPEPGTTAFQTGNTVVKRIIQNFAPGDVTKYTVVIWLEGNDPDCVDKILGGEFKIDMVMEVVSDSNEHIIKPN